MAKKQKKILKSFVHPHLNNASKTLLANIRFASVDYDIKTIVVTSTGQNEGKTLVSTNLANAIATSGKTVLIVDTDMRRRSIGTLLGMHPENGIYAVMSGSCSIEEAIVQTDIPNLSFLDSEPNIPNPSDMLSTQRFASLVDALREMFDYVIFDTPPVSLFIDSAVLSRLTDGTILAVRQRQTKRADLVKCAEQLRAANAEILGVVMTFVPAEEHEYYYAYYTQDGKRVNREEAAKQALPSDMSKGRQNPWGSKAKSEKKASSSPAPASQKTPERPTDAGSPARTTSAPRDGGFSPTIAPYASRAASKSAGTSNTSAPVRPVDTSPYASHAYKKGGKKAVPRHWKSR